MTKSLTDPASAPRRSRDRLVDLMLTVNGTAWLKARMHHAAGKIQTQVCSPAEAYQIIATMDTIAGAATPHIAVLAREAAIHVQEMVNA